MKLTDLFLRAKHWQLFLLTFGLPLLFQFVMMVVIIGRFGTGTPPDLSSLFNLFAVFAALMLVVSAVSFGWQWAVAIGLQSKVPENVKMKTGLFKVFFIIPIVYLLVIFAGISAIFTSMPDLIANAEPPNVGLIMSLMAIFFPVHFFSVFCMLYCLYFVSKTLKTVELQRETTFSDFVGEFFLIWFYPIGIWVVQPRINKMVDSDLNLTDVNPVS